MAVWWLRWGRINDIDVAGQVVLSVAIHPNPGEGGGRALLVDERATPEQVLALLNAFGGCLGGPDRRMDGVALVVNCLITSAKLGCGVWSDRAVPPSGK